MRSQLFTKYDFDPATKAFITAAGITDRTQQRAIDLLVRGFKASGSWNSRLAIYPIVGGNAVAHAVNLKNPGTFNLSFTGTFTHNANGLNSSGGTDRADTGLIPAAHLGLSSTMMQVYSRSGEIAATSTVTECGTRTTISSTDLLFIRVYNSSGSAQFASYRTGGSAQAAVSTGLGLTTGVRDSTSNQKLFRNEVLVGSDSAGSATSLPTTPIVLCNWRQGTGFANPSTRQFSFFSVGLSLSDTQVAADYATIQAFQTLLGRQV